MKLIIKTLYTILILFASLATSAQQRLSYIEIISEPNVTVFLDNKNVGITNQELNGLFIENVAEGDHALRFEKTNCKPQSDIISIKQSEVLTYRVKPFELLDLEFENQNNQELGILKIQSLPTTINIKIAELNLDLQKDSDLMEIPNLPVGNYQAQAIWKEKTLDFEISISSKLSSHYFINMYNSNITIIENTNEISTTDQTNTNIPEIEMIQVKGGNFTMGSDQGDEDEQPPHKVFLDDFQISKYEITHKQYIAFLNAMGVDFNGEYNGIKYFKIEDETCAIKYKNGEFYFEANTFIISENVPMLNVTWYGANAFAKWVGGSLPTEAQWEYAARGGQKTNNHTYSGSNTLEDIGEFSGNNYIHPAEVGSRTPNELGIYDMSGNVWEWCIDWYQGDIFQSPDRKNPQGPEQGEYKVNRGGSWACLARYCRVSNRHKTKPTETFNYIGLRIVKN